MATITRAVDRRDDVVLLCDEPAGWYHRDESLLEHTPDYSARSFAEWIAAGALCRRVIAGWIPGNAGPAVPVDVPQLADGRDILDVEADWDVLWEPASRLRKSVSDPLPFRSAMEMKLCVALASLLPRDEPVALSKSDASAKVILERLFDQVERRAEFCGFCATLARLALVRTPLRKAVVDEFTAGLEPPARSVIEICLLDRYDGRAALHPLVRNQVRGRATRRVEGVPRERCQPWRLRKERLKEVHDRLKGEYDDKTKGPPRDSLESFHHELLGSGADLRHSAGRIQFVEQLDEIGRTLSHRQRDHGRAVEVYRLAVELFPDHAYSQYYLAYNLDWMARETKELEAHYQKAIELQPRHPWFWSRWISYLATRGRNGEARAQWHEAVRALSISGDETPSWIFRGLHRWVARWLLHWAELDFAEMVLREIPRWLARQDTGIQALWSLLEALRQAERGDSVFPLSVPPREWRSPAPHTDLPRRFQDAPLRSWVPARVDGIDQEEGVAYLLAAELPPTRDAEFRYFEMELCRDRVEASASGFAWDDLREGSFLELGYYGEGDGGMGIALHRDTTWRDPDLPPLYPPPDRWYQRAVNEAWAKNAEAE